MNEVFVFIDGDGKEHRFDDSPENCVVIRLNQPFGVVGKTYHVGEKIVVPCEVAAMIDCEILGEWKDYVE